MSLGLEREDGFKFLYAKEISLVLPAGRKLFNHRTAEERTVVLIRRNDMIGIQPGCAFYQC